METITKYKAIDGTEFTDSVKCSDYEKLIKDTQTIISRLPALPAETDSCSFANGNGFIQHDKDLLALVRMDLLKLIKTQIDHEWVDKSMIENIHPTWVAMLLSEYGIRPLDRAWYRIMCVDEHGREWGQPFFSNNPDKAKNFKIN